MADESAILGFPPQTVAIAAGAAVVGVMAVKALGTPAPATVRQFPTTIEETVEHKPQYGKGGHTTGDKTAVAEPRFAKRGFASEADTPALTVCEMFQMAANKAGDKPAMRVERPLGPPPQRGTAAEPSRPVEEWKTWTFQEYLDESRAAAKGFMALGHARYDAVNIFGFNSPEWFMGEMGAILAGGIAAGIYPTDTPAQVEFKSKHSDASVVVVEDDAKKDMYLDIAGGLPNLKAIVVWAPSSDFTTYKSGKVQVLTWSALIADFAPKTTDGALDQRIAEQSPGNCCTFIYTSGTTGNPKAVMITHDNILYESRCVLNMLAFLGDGGEERIISYLPLSHVAGMMVDIICPLVMAGTLPGYCCAHFARPYDLRMSTIGDRLRAVQPTLFLGVPRVWEKIAEKMKAMVAQNPMTGIKLSLAKWSKGMGLQHALNCQLGGNGEKGFGYGIANGVVLKKVKEKLGLDKCKFGFTGAAPITTDTLEYFGALGIQINEVYGMSECCGATTWSTDDAHVWGSCGWEMPGVEVKVFNCKNGDINDKRECPRARDMMNPTEDSQGEICFRGRHIMAGYMANPKLGADHVAEIEGKNASAIDTEGWLHSGDKGCMDERGMVKITGRYKELIVTAGGENIAPVPIEDSIKKLCPAVSNVMMVGDKKKFMTLLVTLKAKGATGEFPGGDDLENEAATLVSGVSKISEAVENEEYVDAIWKAIEATNGDERACPSNAAKIQKFTILKQDFSVETEELTPTLKLKRGTVHDKFSSEIDAMYASRDRFVRT